MDDKIKRLVDEIREMATTGYLPDGDGVTIPTAMWAESWVNALEWADEDECNAPSSSRESEDGNDLPMSFDKSYVNGHCDGFREAMRQLGLPNTLHAKNAAKAILLNNADGVCDFCGLLQNMHERCGTCGYSECDEVIHGDHHLCSGTGREESCTS